MNKIQVEETPSNTITKIAKGVVISFFIILISVFIFSIILTYSNLSESIIPMVIIILTFFSIFVGTLISTKNISKNGMRNGAIIGGTHVILLYLISSLLNTGFSINVYTIIMIISGIISGIIGGVIGVNI